MDFIDRLSEIKKTLKVNQKELANMIGISQSSLSDIIRRNTKPSLDTVISICKICEKKDISIEWLMTGNTKEFTKEERNIIYAYRKVNPEIKKIVNSALEIGENAKREEQGGEESLTSKTG